MNASDRPSRRALLVAALLAPGAACRDDPNREIFAQMLAGRRLGEGCLPADLGLGEDAFAALQRRLFPAAVLALADGGADLSPAAFPEREDLYTLLLEHRAGRHDSEAWMAAAVAAACAGRDHLWQDLGLADRGQLSRLLAANFPALAGLNTGDMKWKKFIYKQLCARDGIYVCPAPSCGECADHPKCFGPEN